MRPHQTSASNPETPHHECLTVGELRAFLWDIPDDVEIVAEIEPGSEYRLAVDVRPPYEGGFRAARAVCIGLGTESH